MAFEELQNGRYRFLRLLGSGGMGEVYLMQDTRVKRQVAIKVLRAEEALYASNDQVTSSIRLFEREARAIAVLDHPNILPLYDFGEETREDKTVTYMVMPYCADGSLEAWLRRRAGELLTPSQVAALIEQAAEALQYAHEHKVIHLDVKPSNFLIRRNRKDPQRPTLLLADFGIARNFTTVSNSSRTIRGTPTTMSPEQWSGEPVIASDQYALAVMAYEMLVGRPPFTGTLEQLMYRHFSVQSPSASSFNPRLPVALDAVLQRALSKKPEERFPSILDFASAFTEAANQPVADIEPEQREQAAPELSQPEPEIPLVVNDDAEATVQASSGGLAEQAFPVPGPAFASEQAEFAQGNVALQQPEASSATVEQTSERQPPVPAQAAHIEQVVVAVQALEAPQPALVLGPAWDHDAPTDPEQEAQNEPESAVPELLAQPAQLEPVWEYVLPVNSPQEAQGESLPEAPVWPQRAPAVPVAEHSQPTLVSLGNVQQVTVVPVPLAALTWPRRRVRALALASLLVVLLGVLGSAIYLAANSQHPISGAQAKSTATAVQLTLTPTVRATATSAITPTVGPGAYIAGTYNGHFQEGVTGSSTQLSVLLMQTSGSGILTGSVSFNGSTQQRYQLQGTVDLQGKFTFTVQQPAGQLPYVFYGELLSGNFLHGNYCRTTASTCQTSTGFFTVGPRYQP